MPARPNQINGFTVFCSKLQDERCAEGTPVHGPKSKEWKDFCALQWNALTQDTQLHYKTLATGCRQKSRTNTISKTYHQMRTDILEEEYSIAADEVTILEHFNRKRSSDMKRLQQSWDWEYADDQKLRQLKFAVVCVQSYGELCGGRDSFASTSFAADNTAGTSRQLSYPAEIAIVEFSLGSGISRQVHAMIPLDSRVFVNAMEVNHSVESVHGVTQDVDFRITANPPLPASSKAQSHGAAAAMVSVDEENDPLSSTTYSIDGGSKSAERSWSDGWRHVSALLGDAYSRRKKLFCFANDWMNTLGCLRYVSEQAVGSGDGAPSAAHFADHPGISLVCLEDLMSAMVLHYNLQEQIPDEVVQNFRLLAAEHDAKKMYHQCDYHTDLEAQMRKTAKGGFAKEYSCALALAKGAVLFLRQWLNDRKVDDALIKLVEPKGDVLGQNPLLKMNQSGNGAVSKKKRRAMKAVARGHNSGSADDSDGDRISDEDHWQATNEGVVIGGFGGWPILNAAAVADESHADVQTEPAPALHFAAKDLSYLLDRVDLKGDADVIEIPSTSTDGDDDHDKEEDNDDATSVFTDGNTKIRNVDTRVLIDESNYPPPCQSITLKTKTNKKLLGFGRGKLIRQSPAAGFELKSGGSSRAHSRFSCRELQSQMPWNCRGIGRGLSQLNLRDVCQHVLFGSK